MQAKIDLFYKRSVARKPTASIPSEVCPDVGELYPAGTTNVESLVTYKRRRHDVETCEESWFDEEKEEGDRVLEAVDESSTTSAEGSNVGKVLNKKRRYAQCFLELGQPDFLLYTCSSCGMRYARGDEDDEKLHRSFHNNYHHGIPFKGWRNERVISVDMATGDRIILVLYDDPPGHKRKVLQMVDLLEQDLGLTTGWLLHELCKVYMFISSNRIVGCVFAEPIKTAHRIVSVSASSTRSAPPASGRSIEGPKGSHQSILRFGDVCFLREPMRKQAQSAPSPELKNCDSGGAIFCGEEPVAAVCGVRAIWVAPARRRQRIASKLLDSVRESFDPGAVVDPSRCAFSQPTSAGKAFASAYSRTGSFLVYTNRPLEEHFKKGHSSS